MTRRLRMLPYRMALAAPARRRFFMKRVQSPLLACAAAAACLSLLASLTVPACYSAVPNDGLVDACATSPGSGLSSVSNVPSGTVGPGVACSASPGTLPTSGNCHLPWTDGGESCTPICSPCSPPSPTCGDPRCLPMSNNTPPVYNFRMEALHILLPKNLQGLPQDLAVTEGITLNAPMCGYQEKSADPYVGGFNWLIRLDSLKHQITTGGALPVQDPYDAGYSFLNEKYGDSGILVAPVCLDAGLADVKAAGEITFSSEPATGILNIPIFLSDTDPPSSPTILPIRGAQFYDVTISPDDEGQPDCIGDINQAWYPQSAGCADNALDTCPKWYTGGAIGGYITLTDAQNIDVVLLQSTLCSLLVYGPKPENVCTAADLTKGDYCSTTQTAGGCGDSFWLAATFAANAVSIADGGSAACAK